MQSNSGYLASSSRLLLKVNSTSDTAFSTITDLAQKTAWGESEQNTAMASDTVAASRGRIIDLGRSRLAPYNPNPELTTPTCDPGRSLGAETSELSQGNLSLPTRLVLSPLGFHAAPTGKTFKMQAHGLYPIYTTDLGAPTFWDWSPIIEITATLGAVPFGTYGGALLNYAADIAVTASSDNCSYQLLDGSAFAAYPGAGQIVFAVNGARWVYLRFTLDGGNATSMNTLWRTN